MMLQYDPRNSQRPKEDFSLKQISPKIVGNGDSNRSRMTAFNLVEQMHFLFVKVVRARGLPQACDSFVEVKVGNYLGTTQYWQLGNMRSEWNVVFGFRRERIQTTSVDVLVKDKGVVVEGGHRVIGRFAFNVSDAPLRAPPDTLLAPQWYRLMDGNRITGELMLAFWIGTQADEAYPEVWHADAASVFSGNGLSYTRSKVYSSPRLWYLRVHVMEAQDLLFRDGNNRRQPAEIFVRARVGEFVSKSNDSETRTDKSAWNEDLMFAVAEPFEEDLVVSVEERVNGGREGSFVLGSCEVALKNVTKRNDSSAVAGKWYDLWRTEVVENREVKFASKLQMKISLDGGYHVFDEPVHSTSDLRATAKPLWKTTIGVLELGILGASGLPLIRDNSPVHAYCVAKYGPKWVRTSTVVSSCDPKWNEQYIWEVYDPCTVISIAVFHNGHLHSMDQHRAGLPSVDVPIGKVKIRLSTLHTNKINKISIPLVVMKPSGAEKMGEIQLAVKFSCENMTNLLLIYSDPLLPKMHYRLPLSKSQLNLLTEQAAHAVAQRLTRAEPPLGQEVVKYMLEARRHTWSFRRTVVNYERIRKVVKGFTDAFKWCDRIYNWTNFWETLAFALLFSIGIAFIDYVFHMGVLLLFMCVFMPWMCHNWVKRPTQMPVIDVEFSHAYMHPEPLDEECDTFPTSMPDEVVRRRYDRLRDTAWHFEVVLGDIATQLERVQSLWSFRDPRGSSLFYAVCVALAAVSYRCGIKGFILVVVDLAFFFRCPRIRGFLPPVFVNLFRRMPSKTDMIL